MSIVDKKQKERDTAIFFNEWFNKTNGSNYVAIEASKDEEQVQKADYLLSQEGKAQIKLQITMCDHSIVQAKLKARKSPGEANSYNMEHRECILQAINDKCKYPTEIQRTLILLVWSDFAKLNPQYAQNMIKENCPQNHFKEIYLVELPKTNPLERSHPYKGNVIKLK